MKRDRVSQETDNPQSLRDRIRERLVSLSVRELSEHYSREAAVLVPVFERDRIPHFLLTRRTEEVETHKGQISFPGGMRHDGESLEMTALRETFEEVGIEEGRIEILGRFHDYLSSTNSRVAPFVGFLGAPFLPRPQESEVAEVLYVPFDVFLDPKRFRTERRILNGREIDVYFYSYGVHEIWGLTARIIRDFIGYLELQP